METRGWAELLRSFGPPSSASSCNVYVPGSITVIVGFAASRSLIRAGFDSLGSAITVQRGVAGPDLPNSVERTNRFVEWIGNCNPYGAGVHL
jgi:hypothetical protein